MYDQKNIFTSKQNIPIVDKHKALNQKLDKLCLYVQWFTRV